MENEKRIKCPYCGEVLESKEPFCPSCLYVIQWDMMGEETDYEEEEYEENSADTEKYKQSLKTWKSEKEENEKSNQQKLRPKEKALTTDSQKEYIYWYTKIKQWTLIGLMLLGLLIGVAVGNILELNTEGIAGCIIAGILIGGIIGLNHVGSSLMQAISAEQSVIIEEMLTEVLEELKNKK